MSARLATVDDGFDFALHGVEQAIDGFEAAIDIAGKDGIRQLAVYGE
jgi:hypothetical protein